MKAKRFINLFIKIVFFFSLFHIVIWNLYTKYIFDIKENEYIGDAGRMSYQVDSLHLRKNINNLEKRHINFNINEKNVDVLTIGDSFSNGIVQGKNPYYQDYIASMHNLKVMNIQNPTDNPLSIVAKLNKLNVLRNLDVKNIIIQVVERNVSSLSYKIDFDKPINHRYLNNISRPHFKRDFNHSIINRLNYNALSYNILYKYDNKAYKSKIYRFKLDDNYFTVDNSNILLSYKEDIDKIDFNHRQLTNINNNLNKLQKILSKNNINLYFMPAVDKYNLYSKYIVNNRFKNSEFFEKLSKLEKNYTLINTKRILREEIEKGTKDVYYADDTHWSYKGSEAIVKKINFK